MACLLSVVGSKIGDMGDRMGFHGGNLFLVVALQYSIGEKLPESPHPGFTGYMVACTSPAPWPAPRAWLLHADHTPTVCAVGQPAASCDVGTWCTPGGELSCRVSSTMLYTGVHW